MISPSTVAQLLALDNGESPEEDFSAEEYCTVLVTLLLIPMAVALPITVWILGLPSIHPKNRKIQPKGKTQLGKAAAMAVKEEMIRSH